MSKKFMIAGLIVAAAVAMAQSASAFNFSEPSGVAQSQIDHITSRVVSMHKKMPKAEFDAVNMMLVEARLSLHEARFLARQAKTPAEHAIAMAKAGAAWGYARAAGDFYVEIMRFRALGLQTTK